MADRRSAIYLGFWRLTAINRIAFSWDLLIFKEYLLIFRGDLFIFRGDLLVFRGVLLIFYIASFENVCFIYLISVNASTSVSC